MDLLGTGGTTAVIRALALAVLLLGAPGAASALEWDYQDEHGPKHWHELDPSFYLCGTGRAQSPIDLGVIAGETRMPLAFEYAPAVLRIQRTEHVVDIVNNGHTIQIDSDENSTLTTAGVTYRLAQYHFHAPSEHTINGLRYPMEMHLVHQADDGRLLVVGVFIREGEHNAAFEAVWEHLPKEVGEQQHVEHVLVNVDDLLPDDRRTLRYMGSLTTPPCTEGVKWLVDANPVALSPKQVRAFTKIVNDNNRPVQPRNDRPVFEVLPEAGGGARSAP